MAGADTAEILKNSSNRFWVLHSVAQREAPGQHALTSPVLLCDPTFGRSAVGAGMAILTFVPIARTRVALRHYHLSRMYKVDSVSLHLMCPGSVLLNCWLVSRRIQ